MSHPSPRALDGREQAAVARLVERVAHGCKATTTWYAQAHGNPSMGPERADVVVAYGTPDPDGVVDLASRAAKVLVVVLDNPDRLGLGHASGRARGAELARKLWEVGRVREHAYLVFPRAVEVVAAARGQVVAPDVAHAPVGPLVRSMAHLHAYVVDTTPRSPQARRRLRIAGASGEPG
jgi:hypothetical protein